MTLSKEFCNQHNIADWAEVDKMNEMNDPGINVALATDMTLDFLDALSSTAVVNALVDFLQKNRSVIPRRSDDVGGYASSVTNGLMLNANEITDLVKAVYHRILAER
jgi:hypothetical protein